MKTLFKIDVMESQFYTIFASRCVAGSIEKRIWIPLSLNNRAEVTQKHSPKANLPADARRPTPDARESKITGVQHVRFVPMGRPFLCTSRNLQHSYTY